MVVKIVLSIIAAALFLLGIIFLIAGATPLVPGRLVVGGVMILGAVALVIAARLRPVEKVVKVTQQVEVSGDVALEALKCRSCGADLKPQDVTTKDGAIVVTCPYCSAGYQVEEAPKW
jgi:hypothetical protein